MSSFPIREVILVEKIGDDYELIIYLDEKYWSSEIADELGTPNSSLQKNLLSWVADKYPNVKIRTIKVLVGSMVIGTILLAPNHTPTVEAAGANYMQSMQMNILINGKKLQTKDPPYVMQNRTLIPVRDITEALGATVIWDGVNQEVTVQLGDTKLLLKLGSTTVYVNGQAIQSEVKTQIINSRTYVPLRLISEQLGATVNWYQASSTITIDKPVVSQALLLDEIHAYTVVDYKGDPKALQSLQNSGLQISSTSTFAHQIQADGTVAAPYGVNIDALNYADNLGIPNYMLVHNMIGGTFTNNVLHQVLEDVKLRTKLIDEIVINMKMYDYDGVEIDFEGISGVDRANFTLFLSDLKKKLDEESYPLWIAVPAKTYDDTKSSWSGGYDYVAIGKIVDRIMIMSYDEHWSGGPAGPVSSLPWFEKVAAYANKSIPKDKVLMGLPLYGYDWPEKGNARALLPVGIEKIVQQYGGQIEMDPISSTPYYRYTDQNGIKHVIWFDNNESLAKKVQVVQGYGFKGVGLWRLGYEKQDLWQVIQVNPNRQNT